MSASYPWHRDTLNHVRSQIATGQVPHALLYRHRPDFFDEEQGWQIAQLLLCEQKNATDACQQCHLVEERSHPNILSLDVVSNATKVAKDRVGISHVRQLEQEMWQTAVFDKAKVALIHGIDLLSIAGQNALLKTLEEPPKDVFFILSFCDLSRVLPTIMSRVQRLRHHRIDEEMQQGIQQWLQHALVEKKVEKNDAEVLKIAKWMHFAPAKALALLQSPDDIAKLAHEKQLFAQFISGQCTSAVIANAIDSSTVAAQLSRYRYYVDQLIRLLFVKTAQQSDKKSDNSVKYITWKGASVQDLYCLRDKIITLQHLQKSNVNIGMQLKTSFMDWQNDRAK